MEELRMQDCRKKGCRNLGMYERRNVGIQERRIVGNQECRNVERYKEEMQECRNVGV